MGEARRTATGLAQALGFDEEQRSNVGIVATEIANNVLLHANGGEVAICPFADGEGAWLDLLALDRGPGIADLPRAMEDGYSTIGTAGQGLGAIERISDFSSVFSMPGRGTVGWSRFTKGQAEFQQGVGVVCVPIRGETVAGDSYLVLNEGGRTIYMMVDGLGHGKGAAEAADEAVRVVGRSAGLPAAEIVSRTHDALKKTRGAAMSVAIVDGERRLLTYAGVGNVTAMLVGAGSSRTLTPQNGTLGAVMPRQTQEYVYPVEGETTLIMFTDGLSSKVGVAGYPGILKRPPALLAGVLYRDFSRKRDDATVMVAPLGGRD